MPTGESAVIRMLELVWGQATKGPNWSWERLNQGLWGAVYLAVDAGFEFNRGDIGRMFRERQDTPKGFRAGYWLRPERVYSAAVNGRHGVNMSVCRMVEDYLKRKPFLVGEYGKKSKRRIAVGTRFTWYGEDVTCTSFSDHSKHLTACSYVYPKDKDGHAVQTVGHRHRITHEKIAEFHEALKIRRRIHDLWGDLPDAKCDAVTRWLDATFGERHRVERRTVSQLTELLKRVEAA